MPGLNLTREEATERASIISSVTRYEISLDLTRGDTDFGSFTRIEFDAREGASTFADLVSNNVHSIRLNGNALDPFSSPPGQPHRAGEPGRAQRPRGRRVLPVHAHGRGPAPLRRSSGRPGLHLLPVRGPGRAPRVHDLRAARPEVDVHADRRRSPRAGRSSPTRPPPPPRKTATRGPTASRPRRRCRRTSPRSSPAPTRGTTATLTSSDGRDDRRWACTRAPRSSSIVDAEEIIEHHPSAASSSSRAPTASPTPSRSTTRSSCPSTTRARWRTRAA